MVMRVKASPALEPNGLDPPTPPNAPARPPPLPRWISTSPIRNRPVRMIAKLSKFASIARLPSRHTPSVVNSNSIGTTDGGQGQSRPGDVHNGQKQLGL